MLCRYCTKSTWTWSNYYNWRMCVEWGKQLHRRLTMSVCSTSFSSWSRRRHRSRWVVVAGSKTRLYRKSNRAPPPESLEEVSPRRGGTWLRSYHTQSLVVIAAGCVSTPPAVSSIYPSCCVRKPTYTSPQLLRRRLTDKLIRLQIFVKGSAWVCDLPWIERYSWLSEIIVSSSRIWIECWMC